MKTSFFILSVVLVVFGCQKQQNNSDNLATASIHASSMVCGSCAMNVETAVKQIDGVQEVSVDLKSKIVAVKYIPQKTNLDALETAITNAGYDADSKKRNSEAYDKLDKCCKIDG